MFHERMMRQFVFLSMFILITLPACKRVCIEHEMHEFTGVEQEARLFDIPLLIDAQPVFDQNTRNSFHYTSKLNYEKIVQFYREEMDRFGWHVCSEFDGVEKLFVFDKPLKQTAISLRPGNGGTDVFIFVTQKSASDS